MSEDLNKQLIIISQVVLKGFIDTEKTLPIEPHHWEQISDVVFKTWLVSQKVSKQINNL